MERRCLVKATMEAVFQDGVFKPVRRPDLAEGERVRITVEPVGQAKADDILDLAARVYKGLSPKDIDEIEEMARRRTFLTMPIPDGAAQIASRHGHPLGRDEEESGRHRQSPRVSR